MIDKIVHSFNIWVDAQGIKSRTRNISVDNISLEGITSLRKLILDLAIQGKLTTQDPNDEPASKLLAKIINEKNKFIPNRMQASELKIAANEKPFQLPDKWIWSKLGSLGIAQTGSTPKTTVPEYFNGGDIPFIGPGQISRDGSIMESAKFLTEKGSKYSSIAEQGDIVMVCIGGSIGKSAIVQSKITFNQQLNSIRPLLVQSYYLNIALNSTPFQKSILEKSTGSATPIINRSKWENIVIPLPPIEEQHRIVSKVDELMALCDKLEAEQFNNLKTHQALVKTLLETLTQTTDANKLQSAWERILLNFDTLFCTDDSIDQLKQTIIQLAVMGKLVKQDPNDEPANELLKRIEKERANKKGTEVSEIKENEKLFKLPKGWVWIRLQQIIQITSGDGLISTNMRASGNIPVFGGNGINGYHDKGNISRPTLVIGRVGYYCGSIHITPSLAWVTDNAFITSFSEDNIYLHFLFWLLKGTNLKENDSATAQPVISGRKIYPIVVALPPLAEQKRIVDKIEELFALCESLKEKVQKSQDLKVLLAKTIVEKAVQCFR